MDHTEEHRTFNAVEFCAGYAGIHLGLKRAIPNLRVIAFSEIEAFACANLVAKMEAGLMDPAPVWTDLKTFPGMAFRGKVGLLVAGYPCQPFSAAGKRAGADDPRHLWPHVRRQIQLMQPNLCFFENVDGHISLGLREVLADLKHLGYRVETDSGEPTWGVFSAAEVGAPHQRKRVFILAVRGDLAVGLADGDQQGSQRWLGGILQECGPERASGAGCASVWPSRPGERQYCWEPPRTTAGRLLADAQSEPGRGLSCGEAEEQPELGSSDRRGGVGQADSERTGAAPGGRDVGDGWEREQIQGGRAVEPQGETQSPLGRDLDGPPYRMDHAILHRSVDNRVDELRLLGNGVVPATAEKAFRVLWGRFVGNPGR